MEIINYENETSLKKNWKNKIIVIEKTQLQEIFDAKEDKEIISGLRYINSNKIESYGDNYLATFNFMFTDNNNTNTSVTNVEKIGFYSDFKTFSIYVTNKKSMLMEKIDAYIKSNEISHVGILISLMIDTTDNDYFKLETIENELNNFDDKLSKEKDMEKHVKRISVYRKSLTRLKHYYEQLNYIVDFLEANKSYLTTEDERDMFAVLDKRIPKLYNEVLFLRDNLSQIRENYQAQVQLKQNNLMKMFTIITAIFMPLQLIVGWYGMNFKMPEFKYVISYPIVIAVSIVIVAILLIVFKKKKWFK
ncbi:MAG: hypothetical protein J6J33_05165 [Clostridia bacterium]|nr:hypothetical protein [Clostridia bacterium]